MDELLPLLEGDPAVRPSLTWLKRQEAEGLPCL